MEHGIEGCREAAAPRLREYISRAKREIMWERYSGCFRCGAAQRICESWEEVGGNGGWRKVAGERCQYEGVLVEAVIAIWYWQGERFERELEEEMARVGVKGLSQDFEPDFSRVVQFLGRKVRLSGLESNMMSKMFLRWG